MGEKGNVASTDVTSVAGSVLEGRAGSASESALSAAGQSLVDAGQQLAGKVRDKSIDEVAKGTVGGAKDRLTRRPPPSNPAGDAPPPAP